MATADQVWAAGAGNWSGRVASVQKVLPTGGPLLRTLFLNAQLRRAPHASMRPTDRWRTSAGAKQPLSEDGFRMRKSYPHPPVISYEQVSAAIPALRLCSLHRLCQLLAGVEHTGLHGGSRDSENLRALLDRLLVTRSIISRCSVESLVKAPRSISPWCFFSRTTSALSAGVPLCCPAQ